MRRTSAAETDSLGLPRRLKPLFGKLSYLGAVEATRLRVCSEEHPYSRNTRRTRINTSL